MTETASPVPRRHRLVAVLSLALLATPLAALGAEPAAAARAAAAATVPGQASAAAVLGVMQRAADWQLAHPSSHPENDWTQAVGDAGMMALAGISGDRRYRDAMLAMGERNGWKLGPKTYHADDYALGQTYAELYLQTREPKMIAPMRAQFDAMLDNPRDGSLQWETPGVLQRWAWCDALFMGPPAWARLYAATGDQRYLDFAVDNWWRTSDYLYDKEEQLYYRDSRYFSKREANGRKVFWGRGNGWVMGGLVRMLQYLPANHPSRPRFVQQFREMAGKLLALQQGDGTWRASLLDPASYPLQESSGTGLFTYALAYGVNQGILDRARFGPAAAKAWDALVANLNADGKLTHVQPVGADPKSYDPGFTDIYGVGAFLMAGSEIYRMRLLDSAPSSVVVVRNGSSLHRTDESVEAAVAGTNEVALLDAATSRIVPSQRLERGVLFQATLAPGETRRYHVLPRAALPAVPPVDAKAHARFVPERLDDFAWENDRTAHRVYGQAIMRDPKEMLVSAGVDVWSKRTRALVLDKWYASGDYHTDRGEGMDFYKVGKALGCGGLAVFDGGRLHPSSNFSKWKVLADGPLRAIFELTFDSWDAGGRQVSELRRVSIDAGTNFSRVESRFAANGPLEIGVGIARREGEGRYSQGEGWMSYWEPPHGAAGADGSAACAVLLDGRHLPHEGQYLAVGKAQAGKPFVYYLGAGWSKSADFPTPEAWERYVKETAQRHAEPVSVSVESQPQPQPQPQAAQTPPVVHIDCSAAAAGAGSSQQPLNSLAQLNAIRFQPGARILFKRGATCYGSFQPMPGSSGAPGAPIVVDSYGDASLPRPAIAAGCRSSRPDPTQARTEASKQPEGVSPYHTLCTAGDGQFNRAALHLFNVEHWEINGLELSNDGLEEAGRVGLLVQLEDFGTGRHYRINDVLVHHVRGYLKDEPGRQLAYKATGGMLFEITRDSERRGVRQKRTNFDDLLVENSEIYHVDGIGLSNRSAWMCRPRGAPCGDFPPYKNNPGYLQETAAQAAGEFHPSTRLVFRNNKIHDIGGDGIVVRTATAPLVEANLLYDIWMRSPGNSAGAWAINTDGAVFQYNEVHGVRLRPEIESGDGMAFDADMGTRGTRVYANYSHDNAGGLMLFCACGKDGLGQQAMAEDVVVERNLSLYDKRRVILVAGLDNAVVSANLVVTGGATPLLESHDKGTSDVLELRGNRFVDTGGSGALYRAFKKSGSHTRYAWRGNTFHGYPASAESGAAVPAAEADVRALVEQWFADTQFRQRGYRPR